MIDKSIYRFERKFLVKDLHRQNVEKVILLNNMNFSSLYPPRNVNNIYFDSISMKCFHENIEGIANRQKIRIRWYGDTYGYIERPVLEIKIRKNSVGTKKLYPLLPFELNKDTSFDNLRSTILKSDIPDIIKEEVLSLEPKLLNGYSRKYYSSFNKKFRVTLDTDLFYKKATVSNITTNEFFTDRKSTVLEIKYDLENDFDIDLITRQFNFRMTKNSKYVTGIYHLYY